MYAGGGVVVERRVGDHHGDFGGIPDPGDVELAVGEDRRWQDDGDAFEGLALALVDGEGQTD